ncbi:MAG: rRNA maturation RNase YbeY [Henriciella sp.]
MMRRAAPVMIELEFRVDGAEWSQLPELEPTCRAALEAGAAVAGLRGEVSLLLCSDPAIQALNATWRGKDRPTDVLSFPAAVEDRPFLGDIAVSFGVARRDAEDRGIELGQHLSHLLIHGLLHLAGYDHIDEPDATEMEALEIEALASLGWPDPYR